MPQHGSSAWNNLCLAAIAHVGDAVIVESPTFYAALQALEREGSLLAIAILQQYASWTVSWRTARSRTLARTSSRPAGASCIMESTSATAESFTMLGWRMACSVVQWKKCLSRVSLAVEACGRAGGAVQRSTVRKLFVAHVRASVRIGIRFCTTTASTSVSGALMGNRAVTRLSAYCHRSERL
jgi:hypothetical protein